MAEDSKRKGGGRTVAIVLLSTLALFCIGGCAAELNYLLTAWWIPVSIVLVITVALALPLRRMWQWIIGKSNVALILLCHILFTGPLLLCAALTINLATSGKNVQPTEAVVERVYTETRYRTKRLSRKVYTRGAPYTVYRVEVHFPEGEKRHFDIKRQLFARLTKGDTISVDVSKGALGMKVFNGSETKLTHHKSNRHMHEQNS